ncbi:hypothetical protein BH20ACT13_BH20ACT13_19300 [soil metagenome]
MWSWYQLSVGTESAFLSKRRTLGTPYGFCPTCVERELAPDLSIRELVHDAMYAHLSAHKQATQFEGFYYALPVVLTIAAVIWALLSDDALWVRPLWPLVGLFAGVFASSILLGVGVVLAEYYPFWKREFWRPNER